MRDFIILATICATGAVTATHQFKHNVFHKNALDKRQSLYCGEGLTCSDACGSGYAQCGNSDEFNCYNYAEGETCCDYDPAYACESGAYCAVVGGDPTCCPGGYSPDECGASQILSIIPPSASAAAPVSSYSSVADYSSYSSGGYYSSSGIVYASGDTCREAFGVGWRTCVEDPHCYNPSEGHDCCSDGSYCPTGSTCGGDGCYGASSSYAGSYSVASASASSSSYYYGGSGPASVSASSSLSLPSPSFSSQAGLPSASALPTQGGGGVAQASIAAGAIGVVLVGMGAILL